MKKITYYLMLMAVVFSFNACEDEDYKDMDITKDTREVEVKEFTGDLNGHIVVSDAQSQAITDADMGETFYLIDNSTSAVDSRTWTITQGSEVATYTDKMIKMNFALPGDVTVSLKSERSSDNKSVTSQVIVPINSIPVTAGIITDPIAGNDGIINLKTGDFVTFADNSTGLPEMYEWVFEGATPATGDQTNHTVQYQTPGLFKVEYTATREDNPGEFVSDQVIKTDFINVAQRVVEIKRAVATNNKIKIEFTDAVAQNIPDAAKNEFGIEIETVKYGTLTPAVTAIEAVGDSAVELTFDDMMYSDDVVRLSITANEFKDATGFGIFDVRTGGEPCIYGNNLLLDTDTYGFESGELGKWGPTWDNTGKMEVTDEMSYAGQYSIKLEGTSGSWSLLLGPKDIDLKEAGDYIWSYKAYLPSATAYGHSFAWLLPWGGEVGWWHKVNSRDSWVEMKKPFSIGDASEGRFIQYRFAPSGSTWDAIYLDDFSIYKINPRP